MSERDWVVLDSGRRKATSDRDGARFPSTYEGLEDYREAVYVPLRRLGHQSLAVEDWAAAEQPLLERSLADLRASDVAVFLLALMPGHQISKPITASTSTAIAPSLFTFRTAVRRADCRVDR